MNDEERHINDAATDLNVRGVVAVVAMAAAAVGIFAQIRE